MASSDSALASAEETETIQGLRALLDPELSKLAADGVDFPHVVGDQFFLRVLRGNSGEIEKAAEWYRKCLEIRHQHGLDKIHSACEKAGIRWKTSEMPDCEENMKYCNHVFDEENLKSPSGDLVWYDCFGDLRTEQMLQEIGWEKHFEFHKYILERRTSTLDRLSSEQGRLVKILRVMDFDGFTMGMFHKEGWKLTKRDVMGVSSGGACEVARRIFLINVPWFLAKILPGMIKQVAPLKVQERVRVLGADYIQNEEFVSEVGLSMLTKLLTMRRVSVINDDELQGRFHTVLPGQAFERYVKVTAGQALSWEFAVGTPDYTTAKKGFTSGLLGQASLLPTDLLFGVSLYWENPDSTDEHDHLKETVLSPPTAADNRTGDVSGSAVVGNAGVAVFRWSNMHSWVSFKLLAHYKVIVAADGEQPGSEKDDDDDWGM